MKDPSDAMQGGAVDEVPFASRPFGWCQTYRDTGPQHEKCDGLISVTKHPYRCPCECHKKKRRKKVVRRAAA